RRVSGLLLSLIALLLSTASVAGAAPFAFIPRSGVGNGTVSVIDAASNASCSTAGQTPPCVVASLTVGAGPAGVAINPAGTFAYVANGGDGTVSVIRIADIPNNISSRTVTSIPNVGVAPWGVAVSADSTKVYVGLGDGSVAEIDAASGAVTSIPNVGGMLNGLAVAGSRVYVADATNGQVVVIDRNALSVARRIDVGSVSNLTPMGLVANPNGTRVYAVDLRLDQQFFVWVLEVSTIDTGLVGTTQNPVVQTILIDPPVLDQFSDNTMADPAGVAVSADGNSLYVTKDALGTVTIVRLSDGNRTDVGVGAGPLGVAPDPTGLTYVINADAGTVSVVGSANTVAKTVPVGRNLVASVGSFATAGPPQFSLTLTTNGSGSITAL